MTDSLVATLSYVKKLAGTTILVKVGGAALTDLDALDPVFEDLALMRSIGIKVIVVHGGGPMINAELTSRGMTWEFIEGQRVTTPEIMDVIETVVYGTVNRKIVRKLNLAGIPAVGISGVEASTLYCKPAGKTLGQVGVIEEVDATLIQAIMETTTKDGRGAIPVIAPIGVGENGGTFNINADWAASRIAQALGIRKLIFLTDQEGILDGAGKVISELDAGELEQLIETDVVRGGMLTKTRTILNALRGGVGAVHILKAARAHCLLTELFTEGGIGTVCSLRARSA